MNKIFGAFILILGIVIFLIFGYFLILSTGFENLFGSDNIIIITKLLSLVFTIFGGYLTYLGIKKIKE